MRARALVAISVAVAVLAALAAGRGAGTHARSEAQTARRRTASPQTARPQTARPRSARQAAAGLRGVAPALAPCPQGPVPPNPTPTTLGVYRGGPVSLVAGRDLAQTSPASTRADNGVGVFLHVAGDRPATLSVDPASRGRVGLQFTEMSGYGPGLRAVRFPACPGRRMLDDQLTFVGGLALHAAGCAHLHARVPGAPPAPMLLVVGNSLSRCPARGTARALPAAAFPYLGIACGVPNWIGCDRIRIGVHLGRPAILVVVQVDGRLVTLSPPSDPGDDVWQGVLLGAGPRHGPLAVHAHHGHWEGEPAVYPRVRVLAYFADGTVATRAGTGYLHAGYG